ncbi:hypothetical protein MESS4_510096 [Mesorhizobium sp. STM 4661]|nr:hypothetical protein MESS4_510096 [Mesorhizobium sp. STM 4661]
MIENLPGEDWRPVVGYEGRYEISNLGRVKSLVRPYRRSEKILYQGTETGGYLKVELSKDSKIKTHKVHILVLNSFRGLCPPHLRDGCHRDGIPSNNKLPNLRWDTHAGNLADDATLENHAHSKLTNRQRLEINYLYSQGFFTQAKLASKYGVRQIAVQKIVRSPDVVARIAKRDPELFRRFHEHYKTPGYVTI